MTDGELWEGGYPPSPQPGHSDYYRHYYSPPGPSPLPYEAGLEGTAQLGHFEAYRYYHRDDRDTGPAHGPPRQVGECDVTCPDMTAGMMTS